MKPADYLIIRFLLVLCFMFGTSPVHSASSGITPRLTAAASDLVSGVRTVSYQINDIGICDLISINNKGDQS